MTVLISFGLVLLVFVLGLVFRLAAKLRLTLPLLYTLAASVSTFFTDWVTKHEPLVLAGLGALLLLALVSWLVSLGRFLRRVL